MDGERELAMRELMRKLGKLPLRDLTDALFDLEEDSLTELEAFLHDGSSDSAGPTHLWVR